MDYNWWRSWHGAPTDPKWLLIARKANVIPGIVSAIAWELFDYASQNPDRGSIAGFDAETYSAYSGFSETDITAVIDAMRAKGIILNNDYLAAWDKRQPKREDDSTERVRRFRERQKVISVSPVTPSETQSVTECNAMKHIDKIREDEIREDEIREDVAAAPINNLPDDPERRAVYAALDACGLMTTRTIVDAHMETIKRTGLQAWQSGFATALDKGKHNFPQYVAGCAQTAMIEAQRKVQHGNRRNGQPADLNAIQQPDVLRARYGSKAQ